MVLALPFVFMDFRLKVSNSITCTDASEQGGAVCVARELTTQGLETLLKVLSRSSASLPGASFSSKSTLASEAPVARWRCWE